jgi:PAS domain S-box-containing protein
VPCSLIDTAGLGVTTDRLRAAVLDSAAQPIWATDRDDVIRFANPAAAAALGYSRASELLGRRGHDTVHARHPDGSPHSTEACPLRHPGVTGERVASDLDWFVRRDGSIFPASYVATPLELPEGGGAVVAFTSLEDRPRERLADEQAALRRVATLVAHGVPSAELFRAVAEEVGRLLGADLAGMTRYVSDSAVVAVATWAAEGEHPDVPGRWPVDGDRVSPRILRTGRPAREDDWGAVDTPSGAFIREHMGVRCSVASPIVVEGRVWGGLWVHSMSRSLPADTESRVWAFTELVATAIANTQARTEAHRLADEQAALRRVATLVARESPADEVLAAVAAELGNLLDIEDTRIVRFEDDGTATVVASWGQLATALPVGTRLSMDGDSASALVYRTGRPARIDDFTDAEGAFAAFLRELGVQAAVGAPIVVDGRLWGAMSTASRGPGAIPPDTEARMREFCELAATAIANVEAHADLAASRARLVAAADEERRRVVRDLHDGAQQRLVHTVITLKLAETALRKDQQNVPDLVAEAREQAERATAELRELVHGILPSVLARGGLSAGVETLASRMPIPVDVDVLAARLPAMIEATAYFVVAEALTNVAKHARAGRAAVTARIVDGSLSVRVRDDGVGGARSEGSGLQGLADRLAALDGRLAVEGLAEGGTLVAADIPLRD